MLKKLGENPKYYLTKSQYKVIILSSLGGMFEYFDFIIYGFFAQIIGELFFKSSSVLIQEIEGFSIFAVGYFMRPLGGFIFSHFGDTRGRKIVFLMTLFIMAFSTLAMGFLPVYQQIGFLAPLLLILLRMLQGLALGGELPSVITLVAEHAPKERRGLACGLLYCGVIGGILLGSLFSTILFKIFSHEEMISWAWRIPFIAGGILALIGNFIRRGVVDSPAFLQMNKMKNAVKVPFLELIKNYKKTLFYGVLISGFSATVTSLSFYLPSYLHSLYHYKQSDILFINTISIAIQCVSIIFFGFLGDKVGRNKIGVVSSVLFLFLTYPLFLLISHNNITVIWFMFVFNGILSASIVGILPCLLAENFPTKIRSSGIAGSLNIGVALFAAPAPLIFNYLIKETLNNKSPAYFLMLLSIISIAIMLKIPDRRSEEI